MIEEYINCYWHLFLNNVKLYLMIKNKYDTISIRVLKIYCLFYLIFKIVNWISTKF